VADNLELDKAVKLYKATKTEYNKFIKALEEESWRNATYKDIDAGAIIRSTLNKNKIYVGLSNIPVKIDKGLKLAVLDIQKLNSPKTKPSDAISFIDIKDPKDIDVIPQSFEFLVGTPRWKSLDEIVNPPLFVYDKNKEAAKKTTAKKTTTTRRTTTKKPADDKPATKKEPADKGVEEILDIARKDRQDKKSKQENIRLVAIEKTKNNLKEVCERELTRIGWGNEDAVEQCDKIDSLLESYTMSIITGRENFESVSKELVNKVIPDKIGKPKITAKKTRKEAKPEPKEKTPTSKTPDYRRLLEMACTWIMGKQNLGMMNAIENCKKRDKDISTLAEQVESGKISLTTAVRDLEVKIMATGKAVRDAVPPGVEPIEYSDKYRTKIRTQLYNAIFQHQAEKGYLDVREAASMVPDVDDIKTPLSAPKFAPIKLVFSCPRNPPGLSKAEKKMRKIDCFKNYIEVLEDEFGINILDSKEGFVALFTFKYRNDGKIIVMQGDTEFKPFFEILEKMRSKWPYEEMFITYEPMFSDKDTDRIV